MTMPGMQGEVLPESMGETASSAFGEPARRENRPLPQLLGTLRTKID
jgi:hypothetical protein